MDYVALLTFRASVGQAELDSGLARRAGWQYPKGIRPIAEYWPMGTTAQVVSIFSADDAGAVWELALEWEDLFDIEINPAVSAEEGLKLGPEIFGRLQRLQGNG